MTALLIALSLFGCSQAATTYVPDGYEKIQWAVDNASAGDTIIVRDGVYYENININKPHLTIKSENGSANCIVQAANSNDHVFYVTADNVTIKGFTVTGATVYPKAGICLHSTNNCRIENVIASNNYDGILLSSSSNNTIANNTASSNNDDGIDLRYSSNNIIANNTVSSNNWHGIYLYSSSNNNTIANNNALNNWHGILLSSSSNNIIANNNLSSNNRYGIHLSSSSNNIIANNNLSSNSCDGICLYYSSNNNTIANNNALNNYDGILLSSSSNNTIANNNALNNWHGIYLYSSSNNIIANNNFINNTESVYSYGSTNIWNSTSQMTYTYEGRTYTNYMGNYWSDYTGSDANNDGIGDTPYIIDSDKDNYPLMEQWEIYFEENPSVGISTDKYEYAAGDTMLINITIANPREEGEEAKFLWQLNIYDYGITRTIVDNRTIILPSEYNKTYNLIWRLPSFSVNFNASFYVAMFNKTTSDKICEDYAYWRYSGKGKGVKEDVLHEIEYMERTWAGMI